MVSLEGQEQSRRPSLASEVSWVTGSVPGHCSRGSESTSDSVGRKEEVTGQPL